ncbi:hypothetical protein B0H15DRAFT_801450 [Mycena belliarum]|uniref:Uncharacterized protein n=1 Tax=Mycena belliarum TaxID=1033014 RepID=A0AAD6U3U0_9AGAR|nr:hypothetical protein B0H15DRAFT_801450 [Mycena belliae]
MNFLNTTASFLADIAQPVPRRLLPRLFTNAYLPSAPRPLLFSNAYVPEAGAPTAPPAPPAHPASAAPLPPAEHPTPAAPHPVAEHPASAAPLAPTAPFISADHPAPAAPLTPTAPPTPAAPLASSRHEYGRAASSALDDDLMSSRHGRRRTTSPALDDDLMSSPHGRGRADSMSLMSSHLSHGTQMSNIQSDPLTQSPPLQWDINGAEPLRPLFPKANTKKDVISFLRNLYQLSSKREAEEKYDQFRICVGLAADVHFTDQPFTSQSQAAIDLVYQQASWSVNWRQFMYLTSFSKVDATYPWFARTDGWLARPYLLDRQRNKAKRQGKKNSKAALELVSKHLHAMSKVSKAPTPVGLRKTRSMATQH